VNTCTNANISWLKTDSHAIRYLIKTTAAIGLVLK